MQLKGYAAIISAATGVTDAATLDKIEDTMRHVVFHSTLDWQTSAQLKQGAREAYGIVRLQQRAKVAGTLPEDWDTAKLLGVPVLAIASLAREAS
jgi:hypothetical protein